MRACGLCERSRRLQRDLPPSGGKQRQSDASLLGLKKSRAVPDCHSIQQGLGEAPLAAWFGSGHNLYWPAVKKYTESGLELTGPVRSSGLTVVATPPPDVYIGPWESTAPLPFWLDGDQSPPLQPCTGPWTCLRS